MRARFLLPANAPQYRAIAFGTRAAAGYLTARRVVGVLTVRSSGCGARRYVNRGDCMLMMHQEAEAEQDYVKDRPRTQSTHSSPWMLKYTHAEYSQ